MTTEVSMKPHDVPPASGTKPGPEPRGRREITSTELFAGGREIQIRHAGDTYTLRQTSKGKLILTK